MWVLTENGRLINLDHFYAIEVVGPRNEPVVVAYSEHDTSVVLCSCDNEEHGTEIVRHIADALEHDGVKIYDIHNALEAERERRRRAERPETLAVMAEVRVKE